MNAHTPFDANQDWSNPYCRNSSNDPMVDALLGNAYHVVRTVYCNLGNLKLIYDFLNQYGMVLGVQSEAELKALTTKAKYARIYGFSRAGDRQVTDYLYVEGDRTGIIPDDPKATGSWITVATSGSNNGGTSSGEGAYIPWVYSNGSAAGGETTINVPDGTLGVPFIIVNGDMQYVGRGFEFNVENLSVTLAQPLEEGDEVVFLLTGVPAVPDNPNVSDWVQINWLYNNGAAVGGEQVIAIPYTFQSIPAVYKNGLRLYKGLTTESYTADPDNQRILLTEPLTTNDRLIVQLGGESRVFEVSDRSLQEVARATNVKDSEVILSTDATQFLNGKKIVYSVSEQKAYGLPSLPTNVYISSVSNGQLTYSPGNITVSLLHVPNSAEELEDKLGSSSGVTHVNNGQAELSDFLVHIPDEFSGTDTAKLQASLNASGTDLKVTVANKGLTTTSIVNVPDGVTLERGGVITNTFEGSGTGDASDFALNVGSDSVVSGKFKNTGKAGVATVRNQDNVLLHDIVADGSIIPNDPFAYALDFRNSKGITVRGGVLSNYTGAISMLNCEKVMIDGLNIHDMFYHSTLDAGGYGFVFGGCNDVTITNNRFKAKDGDNGRHAVYLATQGGSGNTNTVISNNIFDWRDKSDAFRGGAVNIRQSVRTIIANNTFDGTTLTGITNTGNITNCDIIGNNIRAWIYAGQATAYGLTLGEDTPSGSDTYIVDGGSVIGNNLVMLPKDGNATGVVYGYNVSGRNRNYTGNRVEVPLSGYPFRVAAGANNVLIANNLDKASAPGGQAFILFDGLCSNITVSGNKTRRPMFRNVTNVTDLTVDFPRYAQVTATGGVASTSADPYTLIKTITVNSTSMVIVFNDHVTQAAIDNCQIERTLNQNPPVFPVVADHSNKTLIVRFFGINTTQIALNPTSADVALRIYLTS